jgi:hypothetical protein
MPNPFRLSHRSSQYLTEQLGEITTSLALALGLTRMLTMLPLYDRSLDEIERLLSDAWSSLTELRRQLDDQLERDRHEP